MQEYCQAKLTDVSNRLITIDSAARQETETAVQQIRESTTVFKEMLKGERKRVEDMLEKTSEEACRQVEELRSKVRESTRKREDSEAKLQLMVSDLASDLTKLQ
jgi:flagellar hook-basal body complex protein FliE